MQFSNENMHVYFGNAADDLYQNGHYAEARFLDLQNKIIEQTGEPNHLFFLKQTHSADVVVLSAENKPKKQLTIFQYEGDAIITQEKNIAIGVVTADCLPLALHDTAHNAIGIIHAGWRGLSKKIITATIDAMRENYQTDPAMLQVYLGPSAGVCCYEVQPDFLPHFPNTAFENNIIEKRDEKLFFNTGHAGLLELLDNHVIRHHIHTQYNQCTICTPGFCSVRKQKIDAGRQPSVIVRLGSADT